MSSIFTLPTTATERDIDAQKHVNNTVYLRWVQDVAVAHWRSLAPAPARDEIGWVVRRHEIDYRAPSFPGDAILLNTWVGKATRLTFERFTEIRREGDGALLCQAKTLWVPVDPVSGRPIRVPPDVRKIFSVNEATE